MATFNLCVFEYHSKRMEILYLNQVYQQLKICILENRHVCDPIPNLKRF